MSHASMDMCMPRDSDLFYVWKRLHFSEVSSGPFGASNMFKRVMEVHVLRRGVCLALSANYPGADCLLVACSCHHAG
jgi:hypothetical protein